MSVASRDWPGILLRALVVSVALWPWLPALTEGIWGFGALGHALEVWFDFQCHREPERLLPGLSLVPVCARCFGIYTGIGLGALVMRPRLESRALFLWVAVAGALMILDVVSEALEMRPPSSALRLATGLLLAWPVGGALASSLKFRK